MLRQVFIGFLCMFVSAFSEDPRVTINPNAPVSDQLEMAIHYQPDQKNYVGYLHIDNKQAIDQSTYIYVKFALEEFLKQKVCAVVLHLDTPGGEVFSSLQIVDLLQNFDVQYHIPIIAFIDKWAVSAGAMLAYGCRFIAINEQSIMGAAEPVIGGAQGQMQSASEKVNSALRTQLGALASFYDRDPLIAEAMVDKDMLLVKRNNRIIQLYPNDHGSAIEPGDKIISGEGKLLTLNSSEMMEYGVASFLVPVMGTGLSDNTKDIEQGWPATISPVFQQPFLKQIPNAWMIEYHDWKVQFFSVLTHPMVASLLVLGLIIGFYIEMNSPGFGIFGSIALGCLALIIVSSSASHLIDWLEIIILSAGMVLIAIEVFVIPGFGVAGVLGIALVIIGILTLLLPGLSNLNPLDPSSFNLFGRYFIERLAWISGAIIASVIIIICLARYFSGRYFSWSPLVLHDDERSSCSDQVPASSSLPAIGDQAVAITAFRPHGKLMINNEVFQAVCEEGFIEKQSLVTVLTIRDRQIVVRLASKSNNR